MSQMVVQTYHRSPPNAVFVSANSTTLGFQTGSNNQFLTISDNDVTFSDIDGGTY